MSPIERFEMDSRTSDFLATYSPFRHFILGRKTESKQVFSLRLSQGVAWLVPDCAHRATTALSWGLCEQRELTRLPRLFFLRLQQLLPLLEHPIDRLRGTGIQAEATAFQAAGGIEFVWRRREPGAGRTDRNTDGLMGAAVGMADEVIANDHHGFDSFKETLGKDLEHVSIWEAAHFHSFTSSFNRSFNSGICSRLL